MNWDRANFSRGTVSSLRSAEEVSEDPIIPIFIGRTSISPEPGDVLSSSFKLFSSRPKIAISSIEGMKVTRAHRPKSAPGNFVWNKIVYLGSRGSTNIFATSASCESLQDMSTHYTTKEAWKVKTKFVWC